MCQVSRYPGYPGQPPEKMTGSGFDERQAQNSDYTSSRAAISLIDILALDLKISSTAFFIRISYLAFVSRVVRLRSGKLFRRFAARILGGADSWGLRPRLNSVAALRLRIRSSQRPRRSPVLIRERSGASESKTAWSPRSGEGI